jgi:hypothetical protein
MQLQHADDMATCPSRPKVVRVHHRGAAPLSSLHAMFAALHDNCQDAAIGVLVALSELYAYQF